MRGPPHASAARWSRTPRSDRRRHNAPRQPERLLRGAASIGTRGCLAGPPTPPSRRNTRRLLLLTRGHPAGPLRPTHPPRILLSCGGCFDRTRGYLAAPPRPPPNDGASLASLLPAPPRVAREPDCPRWPRWGAAPLTPALSREGLEGVGGFRAPQRPPIPLRERVRVRGFRCLADFQCDRLEHGGQTQQHIVVPESRDPVATRLQPPCSPIIV